MPPPAIDGDGGYAAARALSCPHFDSRPSAAAISLVVIHSISLPPGVFGGGDVARFFGGALDFDSHPYYDGLRGLRVSAHFFVARDGGVSQFVKCRDRAWHAGRSMFRGRDACNDFSIGIELEGDDRGPFAAAQYESLIPLLRALSARYPAIEAVVGHSQIAPGRKSDPGPGFDWELLFAAVGRSLDARADSPPR